MRLLVFAFVLATAVGCKQGEGERCQTTDDCEEGLICSPATTPPKCLADVPDPDPIDAAVFDARIPGPDATPSPVDAAPPDAAPPDAAPPDAML